MTFPSTVFVPGTTITHQWLNGVNDAIVDGAANINYTPPFTDSVTTTVGNKLAQTVSVKDFGAVGDGITDDTQAIQDALDASQSVYFPDGTYLISSNIDVSNGHYVYGEGATIQCDTASYSNVFITLGSMVRFSNLTIAGVGGKNGTAIRLTNVADEYSFVGWIYLTNLHIYGFEYAIDMNNVFMVEVNQCRINSNTAGIRIYPSYDGVGDNGYFTTVTIEKTDILQNDAYGLYVQTTIRSKNLVLRDTAIESNLSTQTQAYIERVNPVTIENCYFEQNPTYPALRFVDCSSYINACYFNGTKGIDFGSGTNYSVINNFYGATNTDLINATGTILQKLIITNSSIAPSVLTVAYLQILNSAIGTDYYNSYIVGGISIDDQKFANTTSVNCVATFSKTVTQTIAANSKASLIVNEYKPNIWNSDTVAIASFSDQYQPDIILSVTPGTTGSTDYFCVIAHNLSASPITVTSVKLKIAFMKTTGIAI